MPVSGDLYEFSAENIAKSPTGNGVYSLHEAGITIYIGEVEGVNGIRERLQAHKRGDEGQCTQQATHYRCEVCSNPLSRVEELLTEYWGLAHGRLPRCNEPV